MIENESLNKATLNALNRLGMVSLKPKSEAFSDRILMAIATEHERELMAYLFRGVHSEKAGALLSNLDSDNGLSIFAQKVGDGSTHYYLGRAIPERERIYDLVEIAYQNIDGEVDTIYGSSTISMFLRDEGDLIR